MPTTGTPLRGRSAGARPPRPCLPRGALVARARAALEGPLLRVVAGAGYGKTALLALATAGNEPVVWLTADAAMARSGLARPLAAALSAVVPGLRPSRASAPGDRALSLLQAVAARHPRDLILVVDDAHELLDGPAEAELAALGADLPSQLHVAVASRGALPPPLGGPRADAADLDERRLTLTADECAELLVALAADAGPEEAARLHYESEGWITGILLTARASGDPLEVLLRSVVDPLPEPVAGLIEELAVMERFTPATAAAVSGRADAPALLEEALARHAFLVPDEEGGGRLRHHRMLRAALLARLAGRPPAHAAALHRRAAASWAAVGEHEAAARHHLAGGDLASAMTALGPRRTGERFAAGDWLGAIPAGVWSDTSGMVLAQASELFYRADYLGAFAAMEAAVERLVADGDQERAAVTLVRLLRAAPLAGDLHERTIAVARRLIAHIGPSAQMLPAARVVLALLLGESCRYIEAEEELEAATGGSPRDPLTALHVRVTRAFVIDHPQGRRAQALAALDAAIPELERAAELDVLHYLLYARAFRAIVLTDVGRFADALEEAERVRTAAAERGFARLVVPVVAMLRLGALAGLGRADELGAELAGSAPAFRRLGGALRAYRHDVAAAALAAAGGERAGVMRAVEAARAGIAVHGLPHDAAMALADLALAALRVDLLGEARALAHEARVQAERAAAPWAGARAAMADAAAWGPGPEGDAALGEALRRSVDGRLAALWSRRERALAAELLPRALADEVGDPRLAVRLAAACGGEVLRACAEAAAARPEVRRALAEASATAVAAEGALDRLVHDPDPDVRRAARSSREARRSRSQGAVRLLTLGGFGVLRDGRRIPDSSFGRAKARVLLAVLACARGAVHREALIDTLWPSLPERRGLAALHSTLYALRRALEPELSAGEGSSLVVAEGATYRLVLGRRDSWDALDFLRLAGEGLAGDGAGLPKLLEGEAAYSGPLLPGWAFAPWTEPLRTELDEAHCAVLMRIAEELALAGRAAEAISRYRLLLALEPEREGWHRALMRVYAEAGERALALRQYDSCRRLLRERLGVEPSRETRDLHAGLLREG